MYKEEERIEKWKEEGEERRGRQSIPIVPFGEVGEVAPRLDEALLVRVVAGTGVCVNFVWHVTTL
jgi:hypothetical protein